MTKTSTTIKMIIAGSTALLIGISCFAQSDSDPKTVTKTNGKTKTTVVTPASPTASSSTSNGSEMKLVKQTLVYNGGKVYLNWVVPSNSPDCIYVIERSLNGIEFEPLGLKEGIQSPLELLYSWVDTKPLEGVAQYRVKRVNNDGDVTALSSSSSVTTPPSSMLIRDNSSRAAFAK